MRYVRNTAAALSLMLFIIAAAVTITLNFRQLYYFDIDYLHIAETSGVDADTIKENYDILIDYNSMFNHDTLYFPDFAMSEHGRIHFEEVKNIFVGIQIMGIITLILSILFFDPQEDAIINVLPDTFFMHCAIMILGLIILGSIICGVLYTILKRKQK